MNIIIIDEPTASSDVSSVIILPTVLNPQEPPAAASKPQSSQKLPSSHYKGVVPQPNGRWGAQIYDKHLRIWLGTFNTQSQAARAYDVAVHRFRNRDAITNFAPLGESSELDFITSHSKLEIVDMLRKHTYSEELRNYRNLRNPKAHTRRQAISTADDDDASKRGSDRELLFEKVVTPSDAGKLNRLVIPKQHAEKHFPAVAAGSLLLSFQDGYGKVWKFRYSYWNSSQSYVLTNGWSRFVKEKGLKAGDAVGFLRSTGPERKWYIECKPVQAGSPVQVIRLFGVNIYHEVGDGESFDAGKRRRQEGLIAFPQFVKRRCMKDFHSIDG